jgi:hypothetical protein
VDSVNITPENFGTVTITRNPIIASMFFRIDYIEQMGTGIERMRKAMREASIAEPQFEFSGFFKVTFKRDTQDTSIGRQSVANRSLSVAATDRRIAVIAFLEEHKQGKVADFISVIGLSGGRRHVIARRRGWVEIVVFVAAASLGAVVRMGLDGLRRRLHRRHMRCHIRRRRWGRSLGVVAVATAAWCCASPWMGPMPSPGSVPCQRLPNEVSARMHSPG